MTTQHWATGSFRHSWWTINFDPMKLLSRNMSCGCCLRLPGSKNQSCNCKISVFRPISLDCNLEGHATSYISLHTRTVTNYVRHYHVIVGYLAWSDKPLGLSCDRGNSRALSCDPLTPMYHMTGHEVWETCDWVIGHSLDRSLKRGLCHWCPITPFTAEWHHLPWGCTQAMRD